MIIPCPKCEHRFNITISLDPKPKVVVADYVVKFRGHVPVAYEKVTQAEIGKRTLGQEELEYVYEIPGTRYER